ncbi:hypothetical protein PHACT_10140 [Pseudohongiella acticola]|uniref:SMODS and SLOG-associating 2TM effector domain-containing protein n=1 Tax=Pseudohongiella acticola TaxID=1524254 RepID=A0A1E8CLU9_9GAMM|nr:hypothetical protein [Pseudohongiella acticola]OFE13451.1 hypothetical protein PHACT_10140 [Pseudohongiella acticola]
MSQAENPDYIREKLTDEIDSLKRVNKQFVALRNWTVTICLASLAFAITTFVQIRLGGVMLYAWLAAIALASLAISTAGAFYLRLCHEFGNLASDTIQLDSLAPKLIELAQSSDAPPEEFEKLKRLLELMTDKQKKLEITEEIDPYGELRRFLFTAAFFAVGLVSFLLYLFIYLFTG